MPSFEQNLRKYAELVVRVGLDLQRGQRLIVNNGSTRGVPLHAAAFVREVARAAYAAGARFVDVIWGDEDILRLRVQKAPADSFGEYSTWHVRGLMDMIERGDALLSVMSNDPDLFHGLDPERVGALQKTHLEHYRPVSAAVSRNAVNWCVVAVPSAAWAARIFPGVSPRVAEARLWKAVFEVNRVTRPDPLRAWTSHIRDLERRSRRLGEKKFDALHFQAPGTDLTIGLPRGHRWISAQMPAENGIAFTANMPTEEVFTLPDRHRAEGTVTATFPLSYGGSLIDRFRVTFADGRIVKVRAGKGEKALRRLIEVDEGSTRLGEVALVPASSPIARRGHLFYNTLFDENASCHLAIGRGYRFTLEGGEGLNDEEFVARGGNVSLNHVDFMIGSATMDVDGLSADGTREPVMRRGEWALKV
jgi:aminopeptidase